MDEELHISFSGDFIEIRHPKGHTIEPQSMDKYWDMVGEACAKHRCNLVLVEADAPKREMSTMEVFGSGVKASQVAITLELALCFAGYETDELSEFFKTVAHNRGVRAEFFSNRSDALKWLGVCENDKRGEAA
jgi:hypothetical protein